MVRSTGNSWTNVAIASGGTKAGIVEPTTMFSTASCVVSADLRGIVHIYRGPLATDLQLAESKGITAGVKLSFIAPATESFFRVDLENNAGASVQSTCEVYYYQDLHETPSAGGVVGGATETTLASMSAKITACNTGATVLAPSSDTAVAQINTASGSVTNTQSTTSALVDTSAYRNVLAHVAFSGTSSVQKINLLSEVNGVEYFISEWNGGSQQSDWFPNAEGSCVLPIPEGVQSLRLMLTNSGSSGSTVSFTSLSQVSGTATATTASAHGLSSGDTISVSGAAPNGYNVTAVITLIDATSFSYPVAVSASSPATGASTFNHISYGSLSWTMETTGRKI